MNNFHRRKLEFSKQLVKIDALISDYLIDKTDEKETIRQIYFEIKKEFEPFFKIDLSYNKEEFTEVLKDLLLDPHFKELSESDIKYIADRSSQRIDCSGIYEDIQSGVWTIAYDFIQNKRFYNQNGVEKSNE